MIKFFRKIRQQLLGEGQLSRYLLYAIGEIGLVVIGILIAVQINNWNQERIDRIAEMQYLNRLVADVRADSTLLDQYSMIVDVKISFLQSIISEEIQSLEFIPLDESGQYDIFLSRMQALPNIRDNAFQEMRSSGRLGLIKNVELKEDIFNYYRSITVENDVLNSKFSDWPTLISEFIDGANPILDYENNRRWIIPKQMERDIIQALIDQKERLRPYINTEVQYAIKQKVSYRLLRGNAGDLLTALLGEIERRTS